MRENGHTEREPKKQKLQKYNSESQDTTHMSDTIKEDALDICGKKGWIKHDKQIDRTFERWRDRFAKRLRTMSYLISAASCWTARNRTILRGS